MGIDDETAKIRRNLVVFCFLYLAGAYVGISFQNLLESGLLKGSLDIPAYKIAILTTIIFLYLFWRWISSEDQKTQFYKMRDEYLVRRGALIHEWVSMKARKRMFKRESIDFLTEQDRTKFNDWLSKFKPPGHANEQLNASVDSFSGQPFSGIWQVYFSGRAEVIERTVHVNIAVTVPWTTRLLVKIKSYWFVLLKSAFWEWSPPSFLALMTLVVIIYRAAV